jgi:hypothetical protein
MWLMHPEALFEAAEAAPPITRDEGLDELS